MREEPIIDYYLKYLTSQKISFLDKLFILLSNRRGELPEEVEKHNFNEGSINERWIYFLPEFCFKNEWIRESILPKDNPTRVYVISKKAVQRDPVLTRTYLDSILKEAYLDLENDKKGEPFSAFGVSIGNVLLWRIAEVEDYNINNLISVVPGDRLPECIVESHATRGIAKKSEEGIIGYQKNLAFCYDPITSVERMKNPPNSIDMYLGTKDIMIPYKRGENLAKTVMRREDLKKRTQLHIKQRGHLGTIMELARELNPKTSQ